MAEYLGCSKSKLTTDLKELAQKGYVVDIEDLPDTAG